MVTSACDMSAVAFSFIYLQRSVNIKNLLRQVREEISLGFSRQKAEKGLRQQKIMYGHCRRQYYVNKR